MAKKRKKSKSTGRRRNRKGGGAKRRSGRGRSGGRRWKVAMPKLVALKIGAAIIVGSAIADVIEDLGYDVVPEQLSPKAAGLWVYGWATGNELYQQFAYGLEVDHLAEEYELTDSISETVSEMLQGFGLGGDEAIAAGDDDDDMEELDELAESVTG